MVIETTHFQGRQQVTLQKKAGVFYITKPGVVDVFATKIYTGTCDFFKI